MQSKLAIVQIRPGKYVFKDLNTAIKDLNTVFKALNTAFRALRTYVIKYLKRYVVARKGPPLAVV